MKLFNEELSTATFIAQCNLKTGNVEGFIYTSDLSGGAIKEENITDFICKKVLQWLNIEFNHNKYESS